MVTSRANLKIFEPSRAEPRFGSAWLVKWRLELLARKPEVKKIWDISPKFGKFEWNWLIFQKKNCNKNVIKTKIYWSGSIFSNQAGSQAGSARLEKISEKLGSARNHVYFELYRCPMSHSLNGSLWNAMPDSLKSLKLREYKNDVTLKTQVETLKLLSLWCHVYVRSYAVQ